jgi:Ca2+-binding EF-hand superfamily protein
MTKGLSITTAAFVVSLPLTALAITLEDMDANGDGVVTMEEFMAAMPEADPGLFSAIDFNSDGVLDAEEIEAAKASGLLPEG